MPITYTIPDFNIPLDRWYPPNTPASAPPNYSGQLHQVYRYSRMTNWVKLNSIDQWVPSIILRYNYAASAPSGPGWIFKMFSTPPTYYLGIFAGVMHPGFPNQYRYTLAVECDDTGAPITF